MSMNEKSTEFGSWSLSEIIEGRYFRVPDYQRGYAWGERQVAEFWEDLCAIVAAGARHYTGAITVEELDGASEITPRKGFAVVDGQQRLTTVAILFSALKLESNPLLVKAEGGDNYVFSYGANNDDQQFLRRILSGNETGAPENSHQRNLRNALGFFLSKVECLGADQRRKIADAVMQQLTFDFRILGSEYSAGEVFETMNNRGKPLTLLEKLKNRLMYLVDTLTANGDEEAAAVLEDEKLALGNEINEAWGRIYRLLASNPQVEPLDEDEYVAAHLSVYRAPKESVYSKAVAESRRCVASVGGSWNAYQIRERGRGLLRKLAVMLGTTGDLDDESIDLALGFSGVKQLENAAFGALPDGDVNRLAPRLGTASEPKHETRNESDVNASNVAFWEAFKKWCLDNGHTWCTAAIASRGNPYYDPQGGGECHLFFVFGESSGSVSANGPLVTVGIYCAKGEGQRSQIRSFKGDFDAAFADCPFDFQDWESGKCEAKRILFVRRADHRNPTPELFARMVNDYEGVLDIMKRHGFLR